MGVRYWWNTHTMFSSQRLKSGGVFTCVTSRRSMPRKQTVIWWLQVGCTSWPQELERRFKTSSQKPQVFSWDYCEAIKKYGGSSMQSIAALRRLIAVSALNSWLYGVSGKQLKRESANWRLSAKRLRKYVNRRQIASAIAACVSCNWYLEDLPT